MERILVLVRHAKSDWSTAGLSDFDRPLNNRGRNDAPSMGKRLKEKNIIPDLIISSPAKRAAETAKLIAQEVGYGEDDIQWVEKLYHCPSFIFEDVILEAAIPAHTKSVFIFGHNPGITDYANDTINDFSIDNMPTCGMAGLSFDAEDWNSFPSAKHNLLFYDYPKNQ